ncbi:hypothetical protein TSAR_002992 [Trichomalopsis sarcophagae]|uniref:Uncharacterized protein n=1 Tax=Trichomalopsis sarcophagae TaxID=543379 RepID=A0A232ENC3_9HYME|nr:hypothetical protein TSAR_002992 [Trichomalopsis sarcophagae]
MTMKIKKSKRAVGDILRLKTTAREKAVAQKLPIQPCIIVIGAIKDIQDTYVCIDKKSSIK